METQTNDYVKYYWVKFHDFTDNGWGRVNIRYSESSWTDWNLAKAAVEKYCTDNDLVIISMYDCGSKPNRTQFMLASDTDKLRNVSVEVVRYE